MKTARQMAIGEMVVGAAVLALACAVPVQCRRAMEADDRRVMAEYHEEMARSLEELEKRPDPWVDEFRAPLRLLRAWEQRECKRLRSASFPSGPATDPATGAGMSPSEIRQLWSKFDSAALRNAYRRPRPRWPPVGGVKALTSYGALGKCAPTIGMALGLAWLLARRMSRRAQRSTGKGGILGKGKRGHP
jgi:hypothetical protein